MNWIAIANKLPEEKVVVETITENGLKGKLMRVGNLWFIEDGSMYVYYTPDYWREISDE